MRGIAVTLACFALVAALLAWSRWIARRRLASLGHVALTGACAVVATGLWMLADGLAGFEPLRPGLAVAQVRFDEVAPGRYRATLVRLPWGRVQLFELAGDSWRMDARVLRWRGLAAELGLKPAYRLDRLESGRPDAGADAAAGSSYALASDAGIDVWSRARDPGWSRHAEAAVAGIPWMRMEDGAELMIVVTAEGLAARPSATEIPVLAPPRR